MQTGDLIGTGTISGSGINEKGEKAELGCLYDCVVVPVDVGEGNWWWYGQLE